MIYRLRGRFIRICMISFAAVFLVLFASIYGVTSWQTNRSLDALADVVSENDGVFPAFDEFGPANGRAPRPEGIDEETPFTTRFFTVFFDGQGAVLSTDTQSVASISQETAERYGLQALEGGRERGWIGDYRYKLFDAQEGRAVVFINGAVAKSSNRDFLFAVLSVFLGGSVVVLLLVVLISKRAVKPVAESYEKQKQFITDANHELKTPLTLIQTNLDILQEETGPNEWLSDIREETGILTELVGRLVLLTRMDEEQVRLERRPFSLSDAVGETAAVFSAAAQKQGKKLETAVPENISYTGDEGAIRQLAAILLDNAVKYCEPGGEIRVELVGGRRPVLTVDNTCSHVGSIQFSRLFDRFYREDKARTAGSGFGIGLSIAKAIVKKHRGEITAGSLDNRSIRFRVRL